MAFQVKGRESQRAEVNLWRTCTSCGKLQISFAEHPRKALKIIDFREFTELEKFQATEKQPGGKLWQEACGVVTFDRSKERTFHVEH